MTAVLGARETVRMPRQMPRPPGPDDWAAQRVAFERDRRNWSQSELARRVTLAGVPMRQQTIQQIESGEPRRKISVGEATALCDVLGISLDELTKPTGEVEALNLAIGRVTTGLHTWLEEGGKLIYDSLDSVDKRYEELRRTLPAEELEETKRLYEQMVEVLRSDPFMVALFAVITSAKPGAQPDLSRYEA
jgi:transcriptional regulator with XRE-family HTH domain